MNQDFLAEILPGHQRNIRSYINLKKGNVFAPDRPRILSSKCCFSWSNWEQYLLDFIAWFSRRSS